MSLSVGMESSSSYRPIAQAFLSFVRPITWLVSVFPCDAHKKHLAGSTQVATLCCVVLLPLEFPSRVLARTLEPIAMTFADC